MPALSLILDGDRNKDFFTAHFKDLSRQEALGRSRTGK
jgi:hypothetical protein